jgi:transcription elongation factor Elf1
MTNPNITASGFPRAANCPFCNSSNITVGHNDLSRKTNSILCVSCGARGPTVSTPTPVNGFNSDLINYWNKRAVPK